MRNPIVGAVLVMLLLSHSLGSFAQTAQPSKSAKAPAAAVHPDFSGVWFIEPYTRNIIPNEDPPFQQWTQEAFKARILANTTADPDSGPDPTARCIPPGVPRTMLQPFPWEIVHARDRVVFIFEYQSLVRQIFTDGRGHPKDFDPTYMGHSIGKYEGNTLVVDTVGLNDKTWLDPVGLPHSGAIHVIERLRRVDHGTLEVTFTIDDPKAYTKIWTAQKIYKLHPEWQIKEYVCAENNEVH
jgi:hypothetical protein